VCVVCLRLVAPEQVGGARSSHLPRESAPRACTSLSVPAASLSGRSRTTSTTLDTFPPLAIFHSEWHSARLEKTDLCKKVTASENWTIFFIFGVLWISTVLFGTEVLSICTKMRETPPRMRWVSGSLVLFVISLATPTFQQQGERPFFDKLSNTFFPAYTVML